MTGRIVGLGIVLGLILAVVAVALQGLVVMLVLAGLHAYASESIPAVGYVGSVLIALALNIVGSAFRGRA